MLRFAQLKQWMGFAARDPETEPRSERLNDQSSFYFVILAMPAAAVPGSS